MMITDQIEMSEDGKVPIDQLPKGPWLAFGCNGFIDETGAPSSPEIFARRLGMPTGHDAAECIEAAKSNLRMFEQVGEYHDRAVAAEAEVVRLRNIAERLLSEGKLMYRSITFTSGVDPDFARKRWVETVEDLGLSMRADRDDVP